MESDLSAIQKKTTGKNVSSFSEEIVKTVFNNVQEGILLINKQSYLLAINPEGMRVHGLNPSDEDGFINSPFSLHCVYNIEHQELPEYRNPIARLINCESFSDEKYIVKMTPYDSERYISYTGFPQCDNEGNLITGVLFARNLPDLDVKTKLTNDVFIKDEQFHELEKYQQQLKDDRELLKVIIDTIPVMITIYDKRIHSFTINRAVENITGWTNEDIDRTSIMELAYPDPLYRQKVLEYMKSLSPGFKDIVMRTRDGRDIDTSWANVEILDGRQVGVGIDISERKNLEKELVKARERAEKENQVQYAFIQNISHEVRTPMNSILGFTELLQKEITRKKDAEFLNAISHNGKQLLRLIDDIIDFSQLDNHQISIQSEKIELNSFMQQIKLQMEGMKNIYKKRHLNLVLESPNKNVQVTIDTDRFRLQQVLMNLIGNAIKYTEEGMVEVGYNIREAQRDVLFFVRDTGIGINVDDKDNVFKRFKRLHNSNSHEFRGTGLGLAICKHLVNLLGGEIWFESEAGQGTVFYFTHPFLKMEELISKPIPVINEKGSQNNEASLPDLKDKVLLIAEDDSFSYMMMYHMLEETKALILHADTGLKAVEIFDKYKIDLIFLDIRLPEMDGYQVIQHIHEADKNIPVVAQTANALPEDRKRIAEAGFDYHITKPMSRNSLFNVLNKFLAVK